MSVERKHYEFILQAVQPIAHHAETFGNTALLMRRKVRYRGGWAQVPCVTGDTMRHGLREAAAYAVLDAAGLLESPSLTESALRLLFAGGMVTGRGDASSVKLDAYREMVELMPPIALLGGCASNRVIPGRLWTEEAMLICEESEHLLPEWVCEYLRDTGEPIDTCRAHVEEVQRVRMDPTLVPHKRLLMSSDAQVAVAGRLLASEAAHAQDDAIARDESKSTMLPRSFERIAAGSLFHWSVSALCMSDLDVDTLHTMIAAFLRDARVGGKKATGHGLLKPVTARQIKITRPRDPVENLEVESLGRRVGATFFDHVQQRAERVRRWLSEVDA